MKKEKSCGAVVYKYDNDKLYILLLKHNKGHWSFPKGHMELGETEEETAFREIKEETNLDTIIDNKFRYVSTYSPLKDVIKDVVYFVAIPKNNDIKPQLEEINLIKWCEENDAMNIITYDNDKKILIEALKYIHK